MADQKVSDLPSLNGADVDPADLLYIVDSSAGAAGSKKITVGQYQVAPYSAGTANGVMYLNGSNVVTTGSALVFDGTNLGVGTSSPGAKLEVASGKVLLSNAQSYAIKAAAGASCDVVSLTSGNVLQLGGGGATDSIQFWNQGLERMLLDASGNLGLGVTPSAWWTGFRAQQFGSGSNMAAIAGQTNAPLLHALANVYIDSGLSYRYITSYYATRYQQDATTGAHSWYTAPSGTAGNAISFTQAMTLDASGNLAVGTSTTTNAKIFSFVNDATLPGFGVRQDGAGPIQIWQGSSGNERARITSGGDLLVGTTTVAGAERLNVTKDVSGTEVVRFYATHASNPYGMSVIYTNADPNGTANEFIGCFGGGTTLRAEIRSNGGIANYSGNDVNLSDRREKTNFAPAKSYLDTICAIPVQTFNYIDQSEDDPGLTLGVVAQDVQAVAPELVIESNWGTEDNPKMRLSIYQTDLQYVLMKCIQEQQALITDLRARVAALEAQ